MRSAEYVKSMTTSNLISTRIAVQRKTQFALPSTMLMFSKVSSRSGVHCTGKTGNVQRPNTCELAVMNTVVVSLGAQSQRHDRSKDADRTCTDASFTKPQRLKRGNAQNVALFCGSSHVLPTSTKHCFEAVASACKIRLPRIKICSVKLWRVT